MNYEDFFDAETSDSSPEEREAFEFATRLMGEWEIFDQDSVYMVTRAIQVGMEIGRKRGVPHETAGSIYEWATTTFPNATPEGRLQKFLDEAEEFGLARIEYYGDGPTYVPLDFDELDDFFITLYQVAIDHYGSEEAVQAAIDAKMIRNRNRTWAIQANGTGQHSKEAPSGITGIEDAADGVSGAEEA